MDQFDVVRRYFAAMNNADPEEAASWFETGCVAENLLPDDEPGFVSAGREANRDRLCAFFDRYSGGLTGDAVYHVRTIGGIGTGWGWVQADWTMRIRERSSGRTRQFRGYTHFLVEDARVRRLRNVLTEITDSELPVADEPPRSDRHYPARPVVGVGSIVFVDDAGRRAIGDARASEERGVVLIKRKFEPLAGQWSLPGGTLEVGETLEAGVARETLEETGLVVDVGPVVEVFDRILFDVDGRVRYHFVLVDYLCTIRGGALQAGSDVSDVRVVRPSDVKQYTVAPKVDAVVTKALTLAER
jgi:8-oxo-dGTP diphosphatase